MELRLERDRIRVLTKKKSKKKIKQVNDKNKKGKFVVKKY